MIEYFVSPYEYICKLRPGNISVCRAQIGSAYFAILPTPTRSPTRSPT